MQKVITMGSIASTGTAGRSDQNGRWYNFYICMYMTKPVFTTKSSTIHKVDYDDKEKMMEIEFRSGNVYRYYNVPPRMWKIFQLYIECEGSAGSFFNEYIKNQFTSEKLGP
jgi:KTSC domain-containing protein